MKRLKIFFSWLLVISVMLLIFMLSAQIADDSSELSEGLVSKLYRVFLRITGIPCSTAEFDRTVLGLQFIVRKTAHFLIYLILGSLFSNAYYQSEVKHLGKNFCYAIISSFLYAVTDEIHQVFVAGRSGELRDVFIDSTGSLTGTILFVLTVFLWRKYGYYKNFKKSCK